MGIHRERFEFNSSRSFHFVIHSGSVLINRFKIVKVTFLAEGNDFVMSALPRRLGLNRSSSSVWSFARSVAVFQSSSNRFSKRIVPDFVPLASADPCTHHNSTEIVAARDPTCT